MLIAQITDTHITPKNKIWKSKPEAQIAERLKLVVDHINSLNPQPAAVLLTGDATDQGEEEAYEILKEILSPLTMPVYLVPGNHDHRDNMRKVFAHETYMPESGFIQYVVNDFPVRLIGLDTLVDGKDYGTLCEERHEWLVNTLHQEPSKPTLIFMHHPLIQTGSKLLDKIRCITPDGFEEMLASFPNIIGILSGHYHKPFISLYGNTLAFTAPSTTPAFYLSKEDDDKTAGIDLIHPCFTLHKWVGQNKLVCEIIQAAQPHERIAFTIEPDPLLSRAQA